MGELERPRRTEFLVPSADLYEPYIDHLQDKLDALGMAYEELWNIAQEMATINLISKDRWTDIYRSLVRLSPRIMVSKPYQLPDTNDEAQS